MTRRRSSRTPSPPRGDRKMPPGFIPYDGIKEEEIEALKRVFRLEGSCYRSNLYKEDPYNIQRFMMPMTRYDPSDYHVYLTTLHDDDMDVEKKYVAIQDLIKQMFSTQHAWIPSTWASGSRYRYNMPLHTFLHQFEPPSATRRRTMPIIPYDGTKEEEIEALKVVFRLEGSCYRNNLYKDDPYNIQRFMPMTRYDAFDHHVYLTILHDDDMDVENKYVAIQDLIKQMFSKQHAWIPPTWDLGSRYRYSKPLHNFLHQSEPPIESPPKMKLSDAVVPQPLEQEQHSNNIDLLSFCILWSPLHPITSFLPFIGHMGISDSIGQPHDAEGCFDNRGHFDPLIEYSPRIQYSRMGVGLPVRYLKVDIAVDINGRSRRMESMDKAEEWDEAIDRFDGISGHSHVARILNRVGYKGRYDWGTMELLFLMFFQGSFTVDSKDFIFFQGSFTVHSKDTYTSSILSQFGPFLVIILLLIILLLWIL